MKKSFMTRALAMGLSLAMAFSLSAATNVSVASAAATPAMASKQFAVRVGGAAKSYKASAATQKSFKITKATVGNTDKATVKVNSSKKSIKVTPGTVTGTTVVKVTFKNIKTAKTTAKKYRCVVKAAIEPEKPVEPEVVKATKITEAKVSTAKTVSVTFDGAVDTTSATSIKLVRGTIEAPVTVAYATDAKSATLTSATPLAAGTYTLTVGNFEPVNFAVMKQTATKLEITSTTVANKDGAGVGFQVLDQYGDPMTSYTAKKLEVKAYNATKGHNIQENTNLSKPYFTLDCATQDVNGKVINSLGDKVSVVAFLKDNASVSCTQELTITDIYMESLEFGEPEVGNDKRVTVKKTYKLPYTAKTNEGNDAKFGKDTTKSSKISRTFGDYTFVSSNISALDMGDFYVDKDGNMFFTAGKTAGTAIITAINNKTGSTVSTTIVVNDIPTLSRLDVADTSIAWDKASGEVKAEVTAYDQFDEVIDAKDIKNMSFNQTGTATADLTGAFSSVVRVPADAKIEVKKFSSDGKYLVYDVKGANEKYKNQNIVFNFTSEKTGPSGYVTCNSVVSIDDRIEPGALTIVAEPDASKVENGTVKIKYSVLDQYQNKVALQTSGAALYLKYKANGTGNVADTIYTIEPASKGAVAYLNNTSSNLIVPGTNNTVGQFEFKLENNIGALYKDAEVSVKLMDGDDQIDEKKFDVKVVKDIATYDVLTDKDSYTAGDTINVTVNAYSDVTGSADYKFNKYFNGTHNVEIVLVKGSTPDTNTTTRKSLEFKNGVATFTMTAGKETPTNPVVKNKYRVTKVDAAGVNSTVFEAGNDGFTVVANSANKIVVNETSGKFQIVDSQGNTFTVDSSETTYAQVVIKDETLNGKDITNELKASLPFTLADKTVKVTLDTSKQITFDGLASYDMATGFSLTVPNEYKNHNISLTITVNGCSWTQTKNPNGTTTVAFLDTAAAGRSASDTAKATINSAFTDIKNATQTATGSAATVSFATVLSGLDSVVSDTAIASSTAIVSSSAAYVTGVSMTDSQIVTNIGGSGAAGDQITVTIPVTIKASATVSSVPKQEEIVKNVKIEYNYTTTGGWTATVSLV